VLKVEIEPGAHHNTEIVMFGEGEQNPDKKTGDVVFTIK
jgi:DnaJ homolog subfamily A member 2